MDHPIALDYAPRFGKRGLHDKLIQRRPQQLSRLLEGVLHVLRHPGRNPAAMFGRESHVFGSRLSALGRGCAQYVSCEGGSESCTLSVSIRAYPERPY